MKSICFFNSNKAWGGGERWVTDNALTAAERGYAVTAVTNADSALADRLEADGRIRVHRQGVSNLSFLNPLTVRKLTRFFRKTAPDGVVLSLPNDMKAGGIAARLAGVPAIIYRRGIALPVRNTALNRYLFGSVITAFMCNSEETRRLALKDNPHLIDPSRIVVNYNGVDLPAPGAETVPPLYPRRDDSVVLGNAGRLTGQKGQAMLLDVVAELKQRGHKVRLIIAGIGELEAELKQRAESLGITPEVEFAGFVESMPAFYNSIDILAHTALWEGFGYVIAEAMAHGKPVAAFDVSSNPELIEDGVTGLLARPGNIADFTDRLEQMMEHPAALEDMGRAGCSRVDRLFSKERAFERLAAML